MLKIGDFSKLSRISIRMLRHYDELQLLVPESIDQFTGYRYYSESQLPVAGRIRALKELGFGLATIGEILACYEDKDALSRFLQVKQQEVQEEVAEGMRRMQLLETTIERFRKDSATMNYNVLLKEMPQRYVASVRKVIPAYNQEGMLWSIMMQETAHMNLQYENPPCGLAVFYDEGYKENNVDVEIQSSVKGHYEDTENVVFKTVPAVQIASATYKGDYGQLTEVNHAVANWVRDNGYRFNGPSFCIYHVSPQEAKSAADLVTEVCFPVTK